MLIITSRVPDFLQGLLLDPVVDRHPGLLPVLEVHGLNLVAQEKLKYMFKIFNKKIGSFVRQSFLILF